MAQVQPLPIKITCHAMWSVSYEPYKVNLDVGHVPVEVQKQETSHLLHCMKMKRMLLSKRRKREDSKLSYSWMMMNTNDIVISRSHRNLRFSKRLCCSSSMKIEKERLPMNRRLSMRLRGTRLLMKTTVRSPMKTNGRLSTIRRSSSRFSRTTSM